MNGKHTMRCGVQKKPIVGPRLRHFVCLSKLLNIKRYQQDKSNALVSRNAQFSWEELETGVSRLAGHYKRLGIRKGDRFLSLMRNTPELFIHYIACFRCGIISVPLTFRCRSFELDQALRVSRASWILLGSTVAKKIQHSVVKRKSVNIIWDKACCQKRISLEQLIRKNIRETRFPMINADSPCGIYFTSGSTGDPKGVTHTFKSLGYILSSITQGFDIQADDVVLPAANFSGYLFTLASLSRGATVIVPEILKDKCLIPLLKKYKPSIFGMLPAGLFELLNSRLSKRQYYKSLRMCLSGGDKVPSTLCKLVKRIIGLEVIESYGMTEIGVSHNNPITGPKVPGSMGLTQPGYICVVKDSHGKTLGPGINGELWIKSNCNMDGYWQNSVSTLRTVKNGWLRTGDIVKYDSRGNFWFKGRKRQIIVHAGSNVCPQEVEEVLLRHPAVLQVAVIGVKEEIYGEKVIAFVRLKRIVSADSLKKWVCSRICGWKGVFQ